MTNETQTTAPRYDLLLCVAEHAKTMILEIAFNPNSWYEPLPIHRRSETEKAAGVRFRGCVIGHFLAACPYPEPVKATGLELTFGSKKHKSPWVKGQLPGIDSVAYAFGIPLQDAIALFLPSSYGERAGKLDYAHRIEQYVQAHQQEGVGSCKSTQGT